MGFRELQSFMRRYRLNLLNLIAISATNALLLTKVPYLPPLLLTLILLALGLLSFKKPNFSLPIGISLLIPSLIYQNPAVGLLFLIPGLIMAGLAQKTPLTVAFSILLTLGFLSPLSLIMPVVLITLCLLFFRSRTGIFMTVFSVASTIIILSLSGNAVSGFIVAPRLTQQNLISLEKPPIPSINLYYLGEPLIQSLSQTETIISSGALILLALSGLFIYDITAWVEVIGWGLATWIPTRFAKYLGKEYKLTLQSFLALSVIGTTHLFIIFMTQLAQLNLLNLIIPLGLLVTLTFLVDFWKVDLARALAIRKAIEAERLQSIGIQKIEAEPIEEITWEKIGGYQDIKDEIMESIVMPLQNMEMAKVYGLKPIKGVLLFGPPGCGKTLFMRALSEKIHFHLLYIKISDILSKWYGESERKMSEIFKEARSTAPCILFFDEIDAIGKRRDLYGADDYTPKLFSLMLGEMDGLTPAENVIAVGSTNVPYLLDTALLRPGRLDKLIYVPPPDLKAREEIFKIHLSRKPVSKDLDFKKLAEMTERYSGADIANLCEEVARLAARKAVKTGKTQEITMSDLSEVMKKMRPSVTFSMLETFEKFKLDYERRVFLAPVEVEEKVELKDVCGLEETKRVLMESVELPLKYPDLFEKYGIPHIKGILLFGPPGCGKTMLVRAASQELKTTFINISGSEILKEGYEKAVQSMKESFYRARERAPSIIFMDEVDSIVPAREIIIDPMMSKVVTEVLIQMDGIRELKNVIVIGATNRPEVIDPALLRPGRFDKVIHVPLPDEKIRKEIFTKNLEKIPLAPGLIERLATFTQGYSGADIVSLCTEVKMSLLRSELQGVRREYVTMEDVGQILQKIKPSITQEQLEKYQDFLEKYGER